MHQNLRPCDTRVQPIQRTKFLPLPATSLTVSVCEKERISQVVFQCCIVAGYYCSDATQGTEAL